MMKLHEVIGDRLELVIISDRCTAIRKAVLKAFTMQLTTFVFTM